VIANSESRLLCAQKILSGLQKKTVFFSPTTPTFHNKRAFEQRHGTQEILGPRDYLPKEFAPPDSEVFGNRDPLIYPALLEKLRSLSRSSNGFFLHTINLSTHTPWSELKGLTFRNQDSSVSWPTDPVIRGYQDVFHRWDQEFSKFLESVLKEDWAQETLFLVLGDHSIPVPHTGVSAIANVDMRFRIPAFLFYPGIKKGLTLQGPFHQVDLMPTLFNIMALDDEPNTFLGQVIDPRKPEGSLWIFKEENSTLHFREKERFCSGTAENGGPCYRIAKGQDPLFDELADAPRASAEEFKKAMAFLEAINLVIGRDQVLPR
jgi:phosphoglycerol transferase MdoB-like AlkP superfamily enzyme